MKNANKLISAALTILLGVLIIILKAEVLKIALTIMGVVLIILAVFDAIAKQYVPCVIKAAIGVAIIILAWVLVKFTHIILAIALIAYGVLQLLDLLRGKTEKKKDTFKLALQFITPIACIVGGAFLFIDASWVYILAGVFLIVNGILAVVEALKK